MSTSLPNPKAESALPIQKPTGCGSRKRDQIPVVGAGDRDVALRAQSGYSCWAPARGCTARVMPAFVAATQHRSYTACVRLQWNLLALFVVMCAGTVYGQSDAPSPTHSKAQSVRWAYRRLFEPEVVQRTAGLFQISELFVMVDNDLYSVSFPIEGGVSPYDDTTVRWWLPGGGGSFVLQVEEGAVRVFPTVTGEGMMTDEGFLSGGVWEQDEIVIPVPVSGGSTRIEPPVELDPYVYPGELRVLSPRPFRLEVRVIQYLLRVRGGIDLAVDGYFGPQTEGAVRQFQQQRGLEVTGVVDEATWDAIFSLIEQPWWSDR